MRYQAVMPFAPEGYGATVTVPVSVTSSSQRFDNIQPKNGAYYKAATVRILNAGPSMVFISLFGGTNAGGVIATTGFPIQAGSEKVLLAGGATSIAAITAAGTSTLYVTPGEGGI